LKFGTPGHAALTSPWPGAGTQDMNGWATDTLQSASALAILVTALIQSFKLPLRGRFHARSLLQWLLPQLRDRRGWHSGGAYRDLMQLLAPSYPRDVLSLPIEMLAAQLAATVDAALDSPQYAALVLLLTGGDYEPQISRYMQLLLQQSGAPDTADASTELPHLRSLLSNHIQRRLDGWQVHVTNEWKSVLRALTILTSALLATLGVVTSGLFLDRPFTALAFIWTVGLLGGLLSSVARDVIAIVEKQRR